MYTTRRETGGIWFDLGNMDWVIVPFDEPQAVEAGVLFGKTRVKGLSFADRACLALGLIRQWPVITTERKFAEVALPLEVRVIREAKPH